MRKKLMRSISLQQSELGFQANTPEPVPGDGEVIVDVRLAGICETDLQLCRGYMGFLEYSGTSSLEWQDQGVLRVNA